MTTDPRRAVLAALDADDQRARAEPMVMGQREGAWITWGREVWANNTSPRTGDYPLVTVPDAWHVMDADRIVQHIAAHDPETVIRRNAGVRAMVALMSDSAVEEARRGCGCHGCRAIRALADAYAPGWDA